MRDEQFYNRVGSERISSRQIDELIGLARGLCADNQLNQLEVEFLEKWLAANSGVSDQPLIRTLYERIGQILADGLVTEPATFAPKASACDFASSRLINSSLPVKTTVLPLTSLIRVSTT